MIVWIVMAALLGVAVCLQGASNGALSARVGLPLAVLVNAAIVFAVALLAWLLLPARTGMAATEPAATSWPLWLGGGYGLLILVAAAFLFPRLGPASTTAVMVAVQLLVALCLDHWGWPAARVPITPVRLLGVALLIAGAVLVLWPRLRPAAPG